MRLIIVGNSPEKSFKKLYHNLNEDIIITTDFGIKEVNDLGYHVNLSIGDFDSGGKGYLKSTKEEIYPAMKDETDLELALIKASEYPNVSEILIYDSLGGRMDHTLTNLKLIYKYQLKYHLKITLIDLNHEINYYDQGLYHINKDNYKYLSLINFEDCVVDLQGVVYPINHKKIFLLDTYTVSNEIIEDEAILQIYEGGCFVIKAK